MSQNYLQNKFIFFKKNAGEFSISLLPHALCVVFIYLSPKPKPKPKPNPKPKPESLSSLVLVHRHRLSWLWNPSICIIERGVTVERRRRREEEWGKGEKGIGSAVVATTGTTLSDHSATAANNPASSSIPKPLLIPSGSLVLAIGSAPVSPLPHPPFFPFLFCKNFFPLFGRHTLYIANFDFFFGVSNMIKSGRDWVLEDTFQ